MQTPVHDPSKRTPEKFPDWQVVGHVLSAVAACALLGVMVATVLGFLETPTERRRRTRFEAYDRKQSEILRRSEQERKETEIKLKEFEREIFGADRK